MQQERQQVPQDGESTRAALNTVQLYASRLHGQLCEILADPVVSWPDKRQALAIAHHALRGVPIPRTANGIPDTDEIVALHTDPQWLAVAEQMCPGALSPVPAL